MIWKDAQVQNIDLSGELRIWNMHSLRGFAPQKTLSRQQS